MIQTGIFISSASRDARTRKTVVYLLFGEERALLLDTRLKKGQSRPDASTHGKELVQRTGRETIPLVVVHTHSHSDHVAETQTSRTARSAIP